MLDMNAGGSSTVGRDAATAFVGCGSMVVAVDDGSCRCGVTLSVSFTFDEVAPDFFADLVVSAIFFSMDATRSVTSLILVLIIFSMAVNNAVLFAAVAATAFVASVSFLPRFAVLPFNCDPGLLPPAPLASLLSSSSS